MENLLKFFLNKKFYWLIFGFLLAFLCFIQYYGVIHFHYIVPPGDDPFAHYNIAKQLYEGSDTFLNVIKNGGYPPVFHWSMAHFAHWFNIDLMKSFVIIYPSILVLTSLAVFIFAYGIFGKWPALISFIAYAFTARTPDQLLNDGGFPNLIGGSFFLPLFVLFGIKIISSSRKRLQNSIVAFILALLVISTHHISTFYLVGIVLISCPFILIQSWIIYKWNYKKILLSTVVFVIFFAAIIFLYFKSSIFAPARDLSSLMVVYKNSYPYINLVGKAEPAAVWPKKEYFQHIGYLITYLGGLGLIILPYIWRKEYKNYFISYSILFVWIVYYFVGSRLKFILNPERFARDMAVPFSVLCGITIYYCYLLSSKLRITYAKYFAVFAITLVVCILFFFSAKDRITGALRYQPMVRFTQADQGAVNHLKNDPKAIVLVMGFDNYLHIFLPNISTYYYELSEEERKDYFPITSSSIEKLKYYYDYIYLINSQTGWVPGVYKTNIADQYLNNDNFELVYHEQSKTNDIYLFKIEK